MTHYKCSDVTVYLEFGEPRLRVKMKEDHNELGGRKYEWTITSTLKMVDFERKIAVTQNSIYDWS